MFERKYNCFILVNDIKQATIVKNMIGIVGGIGPYAGTDLLIKVFNNTLAETDQEHLDAALLSMPSMIDDRTGYLIGEIKNNPAVAIANVIKKLEAVGATVTGIPCNTAHAKKIFNKILLELKDSNSKIKVINMVNETVRFIGSNYPNITKIGVLSTTGTYKNRIYYNLLQSKGYEVIVPPLDMQEKLIHPAIYNPIYGIKAVSNPIHIKARKNLLEGISFFKSEGTEAIILGCTEMPLALPEAIINNMITIDPTNVLARALVNSENPNKLKPL